MKGQFNRHCNRTDCQQPPATWWNKGTRKYYCERCARKINRVCAEIICVPCNEEGEPDTEYAG